MLNRREWINIRNTMIVANQKVKCFLIQSRQRQIRWSKTTRAGSETMLDDLCQLYHKVLRQHLYRCPQVYLLAVDPLSLQPPFMDSCLHLQQVAAAVLPTPAVLLYWFYRSE